MTNSQRLAAVRRCLDRWLEKQQSDGDVEISDAMLIRGGFFVGRKFQLGPYRAVWFMEEDEIKIHDASGTVVAKMDSAAIDFASNLASTSEPRSRFGDADNNGVATIPMQRPVPETSNGNTGDEAVANDRIVRRAA